MPKRVAITIAGAVSLGSYEAGVLYELLEAFRTHNEAADVRGDADGKIYVDVLTGASAGGMTAAMVAERLMFDAKGLEGEFTNALYSAWVEEISLWGLACMRRSEPKWHSLFSSDLIEKIGQKMLIDAMKARSLSGPHAVVEKVNGVPQPLRVGLALTNLNGIDYTIPIEGNDNGGFNYTTSADQKRFVIGHDISGCDWETLRAAAVGSGAFPAAFRPKAVDHSLQEYVDRGIKEFPQPPAKPELGETYVVFKEPSLRPFAHADGGVLQNQPLGIARDLVFESVLAREGAEGMKAHCDANDRLYVFVAPHSVLSSTEDELKAENITITAMLKQLVKVYLRQATFHDWITAENVNQDIRELDMRAVNLAKVIKAEPAQANPGEETLDVSALGKVARQLNKLLNKNDADRAVARLREQYSQLYDQVKNEKGKDAADAFAAAIAVLEAAADLQDNDKMKIVAVIANESELAGAGLAAFAGFFKKGFREHDYYVGRKRTRKYLLRTDVKNILGVKEWPDEQNWKMSPLVDRSGVKKTPVSGLQLVRAGFGPAAWMVLIRPVLSIMLLLVTVGVVAAACELCRHLR